MIEIENLGYAYGSNVVLQNITTRLEIGKIYGLLGENGVGKTTLLTLLAGLKKSQKGTITTDGRDPYSRNPLFLQDMYYLPDEVAPYNCTALVYAKSRGAFWPGFDESKFIQIMNEFETNPNMKMKAMSAGQLKKVYISFALSLNVRYLFMDEPTNALDIPSKAQFRKALLKYSAEESTIVISTHQVRDLESVIDPIIILDRQDVLLNASVEEITSKLKFDYTSKPAEDAIYAEMLPGSYVQVIPNTDGEETKVNIEALFNAAHMHKDLIKTMFRTR